MYNTAILPATDCNKPTSGGGQIPLPMAGGDTMIVAAVKGRDDCKKFLANLGFVEGAQVRVVNEMGGNLIVNVKGSRVAISQAMAMRVLVA